MSTLGILLLSLAVLLPVAWFMSEFHAPRWLRLLLGTCAILSCFLVALAVGMLERLNSNAWFGGATKDLIDATVSELEAGRQAQVVLTLKRLQATYEPTYENRARYDELVAQTVERMKNGDATTRPAP